MQDRDFVPMQVGGDWPGMFIRGDAAMGLADFLVKVGGPMGKAYADKLVQCVVREDAPEPVRVEMADGDIR